MPARLLLLLGLLWAPVAWGDPAADFGVQSPHVKKPAPTVLLSTLKGDALSLQSLHGKVVLLHFWATWCVACREEMPQIEQIWQHRRAQGITILSVNVDRGNRDGVETFVREYGLHFPVALDADGAVRNHYAVRALPTTYVIGRNGKISGRILGARDWRSPAADAWLQEQMQ